MKILAQEKCFDELCGMTINEINTFYGEDDLLTTRHNLVMRVRTLVKDGYMEKGIKDHLEFTYMFLDNNSGNKQTINSICTTMLNIFLSNNSVSELGNVDEQEKRTILSTHGSMVLSVLGNEKASVEKVIEMLTTNNIFAPIQKDGKCEYIGIINSSKKINKDDIIKIVGIPRRTFEGYGSDKTITAISGLSFPFDHLNSIKEIAKQKYDERINAVKTIRSNELEDLDFSDDVVVEKEKKQKPKKLSRREKLKMLSN